VIASSQKRSARSAGEPKSTRSGGCSKAAFRRRLPALLAGPRRLAITSTPTLPEFDRPAQSEYAPERSLDETAGLRSAASVLALVAVVALSWAAVGLLAFVGVLSVGGALALGGGCYVGAVALVFALARQ
jgi:hypothetical protein